MIRLINRRLIIPRGDSGSFVLPLIAPVDAEYDEAYFSVFDTLTQEVIIEKQCSGLISWFIVISPPHPIVHLHLCLHLESMGETPLEC